MRRCRAFGHSAKVQPSSRSRYSRLLALGARWLLPTAVLVSFGCSRDGETRRPETQLQADRYVRKAIRSSSEGVILLPSRRAERVFELPRLNAAAQSLRQPAAWCFVRRAIETMAATPAAERGYSGIPEGQIKMRARVAPNGRVLSVEILETGFADEAMPACLTRAVEKQRFPENRSGNIHHIDVVYWVSLGLQTRSSESAQRLREAQAGIAVRAKPCLQGRVTAGTYPVEGLNLVDREGRTIVNRIAAPGLPDPVRTCLESAFAQLRLPRDPAAFVRPVSPRTRYEVAADGTIVARDERWLELVRLEQRAQRERESRLLRESQSEAAAISDRSPGLEESKPGSQLGSQPALLLRPEPTNPESADDLALEPATRQKTEATGAESSAAADPAQPGLQLQLGPGREHAQ